MALTGTRLSTAPRQGSLPVPWRVGEHVAVVGDTGSGKTFLVSRLANLRQYVVVLRTKPDDIKFSGMKVVTKASALDDMYDTRLLLAPKHAEQRREAYDLLERVWRQGGWTIIIDELWYLEKVLRLSPQAERLLTQGRSKKISVVVGMQRPAQISRFAISQCTHLFTFGIEGRDLQTVREATTPRIVEPVMSLPKYRFVYYNRPDKFLATGDAKYLDRIITGNDFTAIRR